MKTNKRKILKLISLIFVIIAMSMITAISSFAVENSNVMQVHKSSSRDDYHAYRSSVVTVTFLNTIDSVAINAADTIESWDVSEANNSSVMAWMKLNESETANAGADRYDVYIAANGKVMASANSSNLFFNFTALKIINGLENFDTSNAVDMQKMFYNCTNLYYLDVSSFNTSNVTNMTAMFFNCSSLKELSVKNFNVEKVTSTRSMFAGCSSLAALDLNNFNTVSNTDMAFMFAGCESITEIKLENANMSNVEYLTGTFQYCLSLEKVSLKNLNNVIDMSLLFSECYNLTSVNFEKINSNKINDISYMFEHCAKIETIDLSMLDTKNVTNMRNLFANCHRLTSLNISNLNTENVAHTNSMFECCCSLKSIDVSSFNTLRVTDMALMFKDCKNLVNIYFGNFNTENVKSMYAMFQNCSSLEFLDLSKFNTSNVNSMPIMFSGCSSLKTLDLRNFITKNVTSMSMMFGFCSNLETIYVSENWSTKNVTSSDYMFNKCYKLKGRTAFNESCIDATYANIENYLTFKNADFKYAISTTYRENDVYQGAFIRINASTPETNKSTHFTYASADTSIATVDKEGDVCGIKPGTTTITVSRNGCLSKTVIINVLPDPGMTTVTFKATDSIKNILLSIDGGYMYMPVYDGDVIEVHKDANIYIVVDTYYDKYIYDVNGEIFEDAGRINLKFNSPSTLKVAGTNDENINHDDLLDVPEEESLNWFQKIIKAIRDFFMKLFNAL